MKLTPTEIAKLDEINQKDFESFILKPRGERIAVTPKNGIDFKMEQIHECLKDEKNTDPTLTIVRLRHHKIMLCEDNGYALELPFNPYATYLYHQSGGVDMIVGQVLVCPSSMVK